MHRPVYLGSGRVPGRLWGVTGRRPRGGRAGAGGPGREIPAPNGRGGGGERAIVRRARVCWFRLLKVRHTEDFVLHTKTVAHRPPRQCPLFGKSTHPEWVGLAHGPQADKHRERVARAVDQRALRETTAPKGGKASVPVQSCRGDLGRGIKVGSPCERSHKPMTCDMMPSCLYTAPSHSVIGPSWRRR
jgi:hypothetical protein